MRSTTLTSEHLVDGHSHVPQTVHGETRRHQVENGREDEEEVHPHGERLHRGLAVCNAHGLLISTDLSVPTHVTVSVSREGDSEPQNQEVEQQTTGHTQKHAEGLEQRIRKILRLASHSCGFHTEQHFGGQRAHSASNQCRQEHDQLVQAASSLSSTFTFFAHCSRRINVLNGKIWLHESGAEVSHHDSINPSPVFVPNIERSICINCDISAQLVNFTPSAQPTTFLLPLSSIFIRN